MRFEIFEENMARLEKKATTVAHKCVKYGCDFRFEKVGETFREVQNKDGKWETLRFVIVEAEGTALVNDWEFVAELEHTEKGNLIRGYGNYEVPERYYSARPVCEHCGVNRFRKNTYIVRNKVTGEFKQVGKSCLKDFTNGMSIEGIAAYMAMFEELIQGDYVDGCGSHERYFDKMSVMQIAVEAIKKFGYRKSEETDSTRSMVDDVLCLERGYLFPKEEAEVKAKLEKVGFDAHTDENEKKAGEIIDWIQMHDDNSNYFNNLKVVTALDAVTFRHFGLLVSAIPAYDRELEIEAQKRIEREKAENEAKVSGYVSEVGKRIEFTAEDVKVVTSWESCYDGYHTTMIYLYKMHDVEGNVLTWKTGNFMDSDMRYTVKGTVKTHTEFRGVKQTELTRCKVTPLKCEEKELKHTAGTWDDAVLDVLWAEVM